MAEYQGPAQHPHMSWWQRLTLWWRARREARG